MGKEDVPIDNIFETVAVTEDEEASDARKSRTSGLEDPRLSVGSETSGQRPVFGPELPQRHPEAAIRFLSAYVRGARDYVAMIKSATDKTPLYQILVEYTAIKDLSLYPHVVPSGVHPDAGLSVESMEADQDLWVAQGHLRERADILSAVDLSYLDAALRRLGPR